MLAAEQMDQFKVVVRLLRIFKVPVAPKQNQCYDSVLLVNLGFVSM